MEKMRLEFEKEMEMEMEKPKRQATGMSPFGGSLEFGSHWIENNGRRVL